VRLTEATLRLQARDAKEALAACEESLPAFERQESLYSLFRIEVVEALALRQLGRDNANAVRKAAEALDRFHARFDAESWERFRARPDFVDWEKKLRRLQIR
jgi:hypothetical protein